MDPLNLPVVPLTVTVRPCFADPVLERIHQWLADALGAHPDELVVTDPAQVFRPVIDIEPLLLILGGPWSAAVARCHEAKAHMRDKRKAERASHPGEAAEGSFGAIDGQKWRQVPAPPERIAPIVEANREVIYPKGAQE
jgi:hypothetical protein